MRACSSQATIADEYFHFASKTIKNGQASEGELRTAISRAYYAVYLTVRDQLFGADGERLTKTTRNKLSDRFKRAKRKGPGSHELIIFAIADSRSSSVVRPGVLVAQVNQLKEARVHADYHYAPNNLRDIPNGTWREYAEESVELAAMLLPVVRRLQSYPF